MHDGSNGQQTGAVSPATSAANTSTATRTEDKSGSEGTKKSSDQHTSSEADLQRLEQQFVHDVYNAIAPHFSSTRFAIWPKVLGDLPHLNSNNCRPVPLLYAMVTARLCCPAEALLIATSIQCRTVTMSDTIVQLIQVVCIAAFAARYHIVQSTT